MFDEVMYVPNNEFGGYHIALKVFKFHSHGNVEMLANNGYLDVFDFFLLAGVDSDYCIFPLKLKRVTIKERLDLGIRYLDFVNENGPLKYQEILDILDKFVGFKRQTS